MGGSLMVEKPHIRSTLKQKKKIEKGLKNVNQSVSLADKEGIFIPCSVPSSKNGRVWTGRFSIASKTTRKYYKNTEDDYKDNMKMFHEMVMGLSKPYKVTFLFVRGTKHKFDYLNPCQTIQDRMVEFGWIDDDNADELLPVLLPYRYDKDNPGVYINVIK